MPLNPQQESLAPKARSSRLRVLLKHPLALIGTVGLVFLTLFSFLGPLLYRHSAYNTHLHHLLQPPSAQFPLGTNNLGRNMLARLMLGGQTSLEVGFAAALAAMVIGVTYGMISGFFGGWIDSLLMRFVDVLRTIPGLFLLLFVDSVFKPSPLLLVFLIAGVSWHGVSRLVRAEVLSLKQREYVEAARAMGASWFRILFRELLPNLMGIITVATTFMVADAVLSIASLSFLGLGLPPPTPNWGAMLSDSISYLPQNAWWLVYPPGIAVLIIVMSINFIGDAMRVIFDARLQRRS